MTTRSLGRLALVIGTILIAWRVAHVNAVVYAETNQPVLRVAPDGDARPADLRRALDANPAHVAVLLELARHHEAGGGTATAGRAYAAALAIAPMDPSALRAVAAFELRQGLAGVALGRLETLAEIDPRVQDWTFPLLAELLRGPEQRARLEVLAAGETPWMDRFLGHACSTAVVEPLLVAPLMARRAAAGRAQRSELACVLERLGREGHWEVAYQVWLNSLQREQLSDVGFVFNGGFERLPTNLGFDWLTDARSSAQVVDYPTAGAAAGSRALRVTWTGKRVSGPAIRQYTAVPSGRYQLSGAARLEGLQSVRGVHWTLRCANAPRATPLGVSRAFIGSADWQRFAFDVDVPRSCAAQVLQLEPVGLNEGTTYVSGKALFDELRLARSN